VLNIDNELSILEKYKLTPTELFTIRVILLAQDENFTDYLIRFNNLLEGRFREELLKLQDKGIILKSYKIPNAGKPFNPEDVEFNKNFIKQFYRASYEMGEELWNVYPQSCIVSGQVFNLKSISRKFDSPEEAFQKYAKYINNDPDTHKEVLELIKWGIDNGYNFTTLESFIVDQDWNNIRNIRDGGSINVNLDAVKLI
jgi:hypothetical protein